MANIRNLLRQSILDVKKLKQASAETTKDMLLAKITEDVKKRLHQQDVYEDQEIVNDPIQDQEVIDDFIEQNDDLDVEDIMGNSDTEFADDQLDDMTQEQLDGMIQNLQNEIVQQDQNMGYQNELDGVIQQLENEITQEDDEIVQPNQIDDLIENLQDQIANDQAAYTEEVIESEFPEAAADQDQEILERIREILQSDDSIIEEQGEEILYDQQDIVGECGDDNLRMQNKKLRQENRQMRRAHATIQKHIQQTKNIQLRGQYAKKLFQRYNLSKNQKITILQNFDRANSEREIKLVYASLMQGLRDATSSKTKRNQKPASGRINSTRSRIKQNLEYKDEINDSIAPVRQLFKRRVGL